MSVLEWIAQNAPVLTTAITTSAIYDFVKHLLTKTPRPKRDYYANILKKTFRNIAEELKPTFWADGTILERIQFQQRLVECLQSPEIDRDEFLSVLENGGVSKKSAERIYRRVFEEFKTLVDEEGPKNPKIFMEIMINAATRHGVQISQIAEDIQALREEIPYVVRLVLETNKAQLDRIESRVAEIDHADVPNIPTVQLVLRKNEISEGEFFRKEPAWVDFEKGFIAEREEVEDIIKRLETCNLHLLIGASGSGKTVVLKNVGFKLAKKNQEVYFVELKKNTRPRFDQILRMKQESFVLIVDDAHLQLSTCERLVRDIRSMAPKIKLLIGSRQIDETVRKSPKEASELDYLNKTELSAFDASPDIINLFLRTKYGFSKDRITKAEEKFWKYSADLWHLSWALNAFNPDSGSVGEKQIYGKIKDLIRTMDTNAEDVVLPLSVFYQFEIPIDRSFLEEVIGLEAKAIDQLIDQSEIIQTEQAEKRQSLSLIHSSIAELYLQTYLHYPSLGENVKKMLKNDDIEYAFFHWYITASDPTNFFDILPFLLEGYSGSIEYLGISKIRFGFEYRGWKLLTRLFEDERVKTSFLETFEKEEDLSRIEELLWGVIGAWEEAREEPKAREVWQRLVECLLGRRFFRHISQKAVLKADAQKLAHFLFTCRFGCLNYPRPGKYILSLLSNHDVVQKMKEEEDLQSVAFYIREVMFLNRRLGSHLIHSDSLLTKIQKEQDIVKVVDCISYITELNERVGLAIAEKTDFSKMSLKLLEEFDTPEYLAEGLSLHPKVKRFLELSLTRVNILKCPVCGTLHSLDISKNGLWCSCCNPALYIDVKKCQIGTLSERQVEETMKYARRTGSNVSKVLTDMLEK